MNASGTEIGLIFGIYPLVVFVVAPVIGVLVSLMSTATCVWFFKGEMTSYLNHFASIFLRWFLSFHCCLAPNSWSKIHIDSRTVPLCWITDIIWVFQLYHCSYTIVVYPMTKLAIYLQKLCFIFTSINWQVFNVKNLHLLINVERRNCK